MVTQSSLYGPASQFLSIHTRKFKIQMFIFLKILYKSVQCNTLYSSQKLGTTQRTSTDEYDSQTRAAYNRKMDIESVHL